MFIMKKLLAFSLVCVLVLGLCACGKKEEQKAGLANPWIDAETLEAAAEAVGFEISVPGQISNYKMEKIRACTPEGSRIIEVTYRSASGEEVTIRKGEGSDDISGDYNQYDSQGEQDVNGLNVMMKANGDTVRVASWTSGGFAYSVVLTKGMEMHEITDLIGVIR